MRLIFLLVLVSAANVFAQTDSIIHEPKFGSVLRTVREIDVTGDSIPEILQVETTKATRFDKIAVRFGIYQGRKLIYQDKWNARDHFDPLDNLHDTVKWKRLRRIMTTFFSNQNFSSSGDEALTETLERSKTADIKPGSPEADEYSSKQHSVIAVYAGRDKLYGLVYLDSKKKFVKVWTN